MIERPAEDEAIISPAKSRKWMRRVVIGALLIIALLGVLVVFLVIDLYRFKTGGPLSKIEEETHVRLRRMIDQNESRIDLTELLPFQWKAACMVRHYTVKQEIQKELGRPYPSFDTPIWGPNSVFWTLLIVVDDEQLLPIRVSRMEFGDSDLQGAGSVKCVPREGSALILTRDTRPGVYPVRFQLAGN